MSQKRILFLSGTRADFGKLKSLIEITTKSDLFDVHIFATGMHLQSKYGYTVNEIIKCGYDNIYKYINHTSEKSMDLTLAKTIEGLSNYVREFKPELIIVHGDRVEALAGAIVGALNNILVSHIEGGEVSGTIDELIRHSVSKISHTHFVSNTKANQRLIQMGENENSIFEIGSPDIDVMFSKNLPSILETKKRYDIPFDKFAVLMFHPVTTDYDNMREYANNIVEAVLASNNNYIVIYPNNDLGSRDILKIFEKLKNNSRFRIYPSIRFECFLVLLKNSEFIIGNSSAGIREAPYYGLPTINIGNRQNNRSLAKDIVNCGYGKDEIIKAIIKAKNLELLPINEYGQGKSDELFLEVLLSNNFWKIEKQKIFKDLI
jgi:UDP-N-acetylglucosamine 2-epimerase (hydrolysing)